MAIGCHDAILFIVRAANGDPYKIGSACSEYQAPANKNAMTNNNIHHAPCRSWLASEGVITFSNDGD
jgi:hypothetical protein